MCFACIVQADKARFFLRLNPADFRNALLKKGTAIMKNANSTALKIPSWYIEFLAALLRQAPQLEEIDQVTAEGWINNQKSLKNKLTGCLIYPPMTTKSPESNSLLKFVGTVLVPATTAKFVAKDKFVVNTKRNAPVKISYLGDNFTEWFLSGDGKTEDPITGQTLRYHELRQSSMDGPIIAELGGAERAETTLLEIFSLMEKQGKGKDGVLLNNGHANLFCVKDGTSVLRAVYVHWRDDGWSVGADSVGGMHRWDDGARVFFRNFVL